MSNKVISIIIPIYNGDKYLKECLKSIMDSSYYNIEVIMINDGSTDRSQEICEEFEKQDNRFRLYNKENGGIVSSRNFGLKHVSGEYITFCDQDDIVPKNAYIYMMNAIVKSNSDIVIGSFKFKSPNGIIQGITYENRDYVKEQLDDEFLLPLIMYDIEFKYNKIFRKPNNYVWNCLYKNEVISKNNLHFFNFFEYEDDMLFNIQYISIINKITTIENNVYLWRQEKKSTNKKERYTDNILKKDETLKEYLCDKVKNMKISEERRIDYICALRESNFIRYFDYECYKCHDDYSTIRNNYYAFQKKCKITKKRIHNLAYDIIYTNDYFNHYWLSKGKIKIAYIYNKYIFKKFIHKIYIIYTMIRNY